MLLIISTNALIQLGEITGNYKLEMSWNNYDSNIVDEYHVCSKGGCTKPLIRLGLD